MSGLLNVGARALMANQSALQTIGNNIANVNTPGYSRQSVVLQNVAGEFTGSGFYGKGVEIVTVQRNYSEFLTKQAAVAKSVAASDSTRYSNLRQLEDIFQGGPDGLGAAVSNMLNSFSDITSAPNDLTARTVALTRADETATRFQAVTTQINDLRIGTIGQLKTDVIAINSLAEQIAKSNIKIAEAKGSGQSPNDLLDQRDQLISELNRYIQTSTIAADDGSVGIFIAGSQPLVLGKTVSPVKIIDDNFTDIAKSQFAITVAGATQPIDAARLGGGEVAGLLRFQNSDLVDATNLLGRMALAIGTRMNEQQALGLDLSGNAGVALFSLKNLPNGLPASTNTGTDTLTVSVQSNPSGTTSFNPSDYVFSFASATTGTLTRLSDNVVTNFDFSTPPVVVDGLTIQSTGAAAAGDRFLIKPFSKAASSITTAFSSPKSLAMASPITGSAGVANLGTLTLDRLAVKTVPAPAVAFPQVDLSFALNTVTGDFEYTSSNPAAVPITGVYTPGVPIAMSISGWSFELTLKGVPNNAVAPTLPDTYSIKTNTAPMLNADNAQAMLDLRDLAMFDGGPLTDGYASLMSEIGVKVQSGKSSSAVSSGIFTNIDKDRAGVSGVNLDEEAAKLLQFQQAYQASGKMMQIAQNVFDTLLQSLGR